MGIEEKIIERLKAFPKKVKAAALYGSFARGTQRPDSDLDLLVLSDEVDPRRHRRGKEIAAIKHLLALDVPVDVLLLTTSECLSNFRNHNPLFLDIACDGIVLVDSSNFLGPLIKETKSYIKQIKIKKLEDGWAFAMTERTPILL